MARGQRPFQDFIRIHRLAIRLGAIAAVVLLLIAGWRILVASQPAPATMVRQNNSSTIPACTYADATFCPTETRYRTFVASQAASDILESQVITPHTCSTQDANDQYCDGASAGFTMSLYNIVDNGQPRLFTRNTGIAYLRSFFTAHSPFTFQAANSGQAADAIVMVFVSHAGNAHLLLHFTKSNGGWQFTYPEATTGTTP